MVFNGFIRLNFVQFQSNGPVPSQIGVKLMGSGYIQGLLAWIYHVVPQMGPTLSHLASPIEEFDVLDEGRISPFSLPSHSAYFSQRVTRRISLFRPGFDRNYPASPMEDFDVPYTS